MVGKGEESQAQTIAGAPEEVASSRADMAGGATAAATGAGAPTFGEVFSIFASLCRFASGIAGGVTAPLLLLSYRQYKEDQQHNAWPCSEAQLLSCPL